MYLDEKCNPETSSAFLREKCKLDMSCNPDSSAFLRCAFLGERCNSCGRKVQLRHTSCAFCNLDTRIAPFLEKGTTRTHELHLSRRMVQTRTHELRLSHRKVQLAHTSCAFLRESYNSDTQVAPFSEKRWKSDMSRAFLRERCKSDTTRGFLKERCKSDTTCAFLGERCNSRH
jgi:hypothetical protein